MSAPSPRGVACPDKLRGSLDAPAAAAALARGLEGGGVATAAVPLADGGEGTLDALLAAGGAIAAATVTGPEGRPVVARWGMLADGTAILESAEVCGHARLTTANRPLEATSRGVGELLLVAAAAGARRAVVGVGGTATMDAGIDAADALGWRLPLPVVAACDVATPLGDAARLFAPQKGADPQAVRLLATRLTAAGRRLDGHAGIAVSERAGSGAGGGLGAALAALGATLASGAALVADRVGLDHHLAGADLVVTGEGRLDATSLAGKVVGEVLRRSARQGLARAVVCGSAAPDVDLPGDVRVVDLLSLAGSMAVSVLSAAALLERRGAELATWRRALLAVPRR